MKLEITNKLSRSAYKAAFKIRKYSPEILAVAGVVGVVAGTVIACKATTKASKITEESKKQLKDIHELAEAKEITIYNQETEQDEVVVYTEEDKNKDITIVYAKTGLKLAKTYAPAAMVIGLGVGALLASNNILRNRYIASAAACAALDKGFKEYRGRVVERFGADLDRELKYNLKAQEIKETVIDEETGKKKTVKKTIHVMDPNHYSPYSIIFDDGNTGWDKDPEVNKFFLIQQQNHANDMLKSRGYLFLNEVYEMLGAPKTKAGHVVGWVYDEKNPVGDNFVDFGLFDIDCERTRDFMNLRERNIVLDFNVDGDIYNLVW